MANSFYNLTVVEALFEKMSLEQMILNIVRCYIY